MLNCQLIPLSIGNPRVDDAERALQVRHCFRRAVIEDLSSLVDQAVTENKFGAVLVAGDALDASMLNSAIFDTFRSCVGVRLFVTLHF